MISTPFNNPGAVRRGAEQVNAHRTIRSSARNMLGALRLETLPLR